MKTVPNQRILTIQKQPTDKQHLYTTNNLSALSEAVRRLQSKGGFKLYMYLAKNQPGYKLALSSSDFMIWSGLGMSAYRSAFAELEQEGYLIKEPGAEAHYTFYDKSQNQETRQDSIEIDIVKS